MKTGNTPARAGGPHPNPRASMEPGHEDREYVQVPAHQVQVPGASMEPGHEDREYLADLRETGAVTTVPQWSPVMKTGNTKLASASRNTVTEPQWSPVMKTGNTAPAPGTCTWHLMPQWSPVMKTGNTPFKLATRRCD